MVTHQDLTDRARQRTASAVHVSVGNFMGSPRHDEIVDLLHRTNGERRCRPGWGRGGPGWGRMLADAAVPLHGTATSRDEAITEAGFVIGVAGAGKDHLALLGRIAQVFVDDARVAELEAAESAADVQRILGRVAPAR